MAREIKKYIFLLIGTLALALGVVGAFLPIIPVTPLVMLACYLYSKSSDRFHTWLMNTNLYSKYAKDFVENRQLTAKRKIVLLSFASTMLLFPLFILEGMMKIVIVAIYMYLYYYFIFKIKTINQNEVKII